MSYSSAGKLVPYQNQNQSCNTPTAAAAGDRALTCVVSRHPHDTYADTRQSTLPAPPSPLCSQTQTSVCVSRPVHSIHGRRRVVVRVARPPLYWVVTTPYPDAGTLNMERQTTVTCTTWTTWLGQCTRLKYTDICSEYMDKVCGCFEAACPISTCACSHGLLSVRRAEQSSWQSSTGPQGQQFSPL